MMVMKPSQEQMILEHLKEGRSITPLEALNRYGCFRLAAVIHKLREDYLIETENTESENGKHFATYKLVRELYKGEPKQMELL